MESIAITGGNGVIGSVLTEGLKGEYPITSIDKQKNPEHDVTKLEILLPLFQGKKAVIHLAWNMDEIAWNEGKSEDNMMMARNVFEAALRDDVKRVVLASSVHADRYYKDWDGLELLSPQREHPQPWPDLPLNKYGHTKLEIENLAKQYARKGLEIVCIRFGGVYRHGENPDEEHKHTWLSHRDAVNMVRKVLEANEVPNNFSVFYGISNNQGRRIHDISNPFGWIPEDNA